jgi:hypothetical protein
VSAQSSAAAAALLVLSLCAQSASAQVARGSVQERHVRAVYAERLERLLAAWETVDGAGREACERLFAGARGESGPRDAWPDLAALSAGLRVLQGADPARCGPGSLAALADSLDLQVVPGTFEPVAAGAGPAEPLTVRVYPVAARPAGLAARDVSLELRWIAPDGTESTARTEEVRRNAFQPAGFDMYVRAPIAAAGEAHHLVAVLREASGASERSVPVPVECVDGFQAAFVEAHADFSESAKGAYDLNLGLALEELRDLYVTGCRTTRGDGAAALLEHALARATGVPAPPVTARPLGPIVPAPLSEGPALWVREPASAPRWTVVLPAPSRTASESVFAGRLGAAWGSVADASGLRLVAADLPAASADRVSALVADAAVRWPDQPLALVVRGDAIVSYLFERAGWSGPEPAAVVLASSSEKVGDVLSGERALVVGPLPDSGDAGGASGPPGGARSVRIDVPLPVLEVLLPAHVADFLERGEGE